MPDRLSLRAAGRAVGCDHAHLARLVKQGRLRRGADGLVDVTDVHAVMRQADPAMKRKEVVTKGGHKSPPGHRSPPPTVTTNKPAAGTPEQREGRLLDILADVPRDAVWLLESTATPAHVRYALFDWLKGIIQAELYESFPHPDFAEPDWTEIAAETGEALDLPAWMRWTQDKLDEFDAADRG